MFVYVAAASRAFLPITIVLKKMSMCLGAQATCITPNTYVVSTFWQLKNVERQQAALIYALDFGRSLLSLFILYVMCLAAKQYGSKPHL